MTDKPKCYWCARPLTNGHCLNFGCWELQPKPVQEPVTVSYASVVRGDLDRKAELAAGLDSFKKRRSYDF